jgi:glyoxylase-like metal-dependent hydrolase (beta-lactamase superfamily II)
VPTPPPCVDLATDVTVLVRGWLHGNSVLLHGDGAALVDTGYHTGTEVLQAWLTARLGARPLDGLLLTHAHSDHAGGVAALTATRPLPVLASTATRALVDTWDERGLWIGPSGQELPRFQVDAAFDPGELVPAGGRRWRVIATPGHMRSAVALHDEEDGLLITGDALWEDGFGMLDPWVEGLGCFEETAATLARLRALRGVRAVIPGHGAPFRDLAAALDRAEARLAAIRRDPDAIRRMVALGSVAFLSLARPELDRTALAALALRAVEEHPPYAPGPGVPDAQALVHQAFAELAARATSRR